VGFQVQEQRPFVDSIPEIPFLLQSTLRPGAKVMVQALELFVLTNGNSEVNLRGEFSLTTKLYLYPSNPIACLEASFHVVWN